MLAVPVVDPRFAEIDDLPRLPAHWRREIAEFFEVCKRLEGKRTDAGAWHDAGAARRKIADAIGAHARAAQSRAPWSGAIAGRRSDPGR